MNNQNGINNCFLLLCNLYETKKQAGKQILQKNETLGIYKYNTVRSAATHSLLCKMTFREPCKNNSTETTNLHILDADLGKEKNVYEKTGIYTPLGAKPPAVATISTGLKQNRTNPCSQHVTQCHLNFVGSMFAA